MHLRSIAIMFTMFSIGAVSALGAASTEKADRTFTATALTSEYPLSADALTFTREAMGDIFLPLGDKICRCKGTALNEGSSYKFGMSLKTMGKIRETNPTLEEALNSLSYPLSLALIPSKNPDLPKVFEMVWDITSLGGDTSRLFLRLIELKHGVASTESESASELRLLK